MSAEVWLSPSALIDMLQNLRATPFAAQLPHPPLPNWWATVVAEQALVFPEEMTRQAVTEHVDDGLSVMPARAVPCRPPQVKKVLAMWALAIPLARELL